MASTAGPRVLVITLAFGSGHAKAADAIARAVVRQSPDATVRVIDALERSRWLFRALYVWPYWLMLRYAPSLWRRLFSARVRHLHRHTAPAWSFRFGCRAVYDTIAAFQPDVIVAAEVGACEIALDARRRVLSAAPIVNVVTDHQAEPAWVHRDVDAYAVADAGVRTQLIEWGAVAERIFVSGIPTAASGTAATGAQVCDADARPIVLLMGGGMGPTRMDRVAAALIACGRRMRIVAVTGHDRRARRRLADLQATADATLAVFGWRDDIDRLMTSATVLVTKPGGVTIAEAAVHGLPAVLFDPIPGPEEQNAACVAAAGAGVMTRGSQETASAVIDLLADETARHRMAAGMREIARPDAADAVAGVVLRAARVRPVVILTIANGAGHTRAAEAVAEAVSAEEPALGAVVVEVSDYMTWVTRLTHVTIYLWLVKYVPALWERIDRYQKRQPHTSPEWYYRRGCRRLFDLVRRMRPRAIVATEVGCCEIAALIKRDLGLDVPLVAVNGEYEAERAWLQPEIDAYSVSTAAVGDSLCALGAPRGLVHAWGVPVAAAFSRSVPREDVRNAACRRLGLSAAHPIVLVGGGSEGLGRVDLVVRCLLGLADRRVQIVVLAGKNRRLAARCERAAAGAPERVRVLAWTPSVADLMHAADLMVSKPGHTFDEAIACGLPLICLPPPPGAEREQYRLIEELHAGHAVRDLDDLAVVVTRLLEQGDALAAARTAAARAARPAPARSIAQWIGVAVHGDPAVALVPRERRHGSQRLVAAEGSR